MSARTCLLCGKALSRLRAEGDFCSKDHKNQHRLRAGMNRLQEADKVANLMRRRENPRQIGSARLMCNSDGAPRVCEPPRLLSTQSTPSGAWPVFSVYGTPHMPKFPQGYRDPSPDGKSATANPRLPNSTRIRVGANKHFPAMITRRLKLPAGLAPARAARLRAALPQATPQQRSMDRLPHGQSRVLWGPGPEMLRRADALGRVSIHQAAGTRKLRSAARRGKALRVSTAIGFRVPSAHQRPYASQSIMRNALIWPGRPYSTAPGSISLLADPRQLGVRIPTAAAWCPSGPGLIRSKRFTQANAVAVPSGSPAKGGKLPAKFCIVDWNPADPRWAGTVPGPDSAGFRSRNGVHFYALPMRPFAIDAVQQLAAAPIQVREGPVGYPKVTIEDTLAGAILSPGSLPATAGSLPTDSDENQMGNVVVMAPVQRRFEENFDSGWNNWSGGTADWKVDIAGVRTGSLALFNPSIDLIDYELEFLTRIDHRSVTWVVRAANPNEYCRCTLTALAGGELEFSHSVLFDGVGEPAVSAAGRITAKPRSAITVRTHVQGQTFTVTANGVHVDTWTDARLPIGGIGFMGTPEDRARLYWIRLTSTGSPGKEYRKP